MLDITEVTMLDVRDPQKVQIELSSDGTKLWVNIDNICLLRVQNSKKPISIALEGFEAFEP